MQQPFLVDFVISPLESLPEQVEKPAGRIKDGNPIEAQTQPHRGYRL
jgi:hypothetical protein